MTAPASPYSPLLLEVVRAELMRGEYAPNTLRAYRQEWNQFCEWCVAAGLPSRPVASETLLLHIAAAVANGSRLQTLNLRLASIAYHHRLEGLKNPINEDVRTLIRNAGRVLKEKSKAKKALSVEMLRTLSEHLGRDPQDTLAVRDRAALVLGFALGWRKTEIEEMQLGDISHTSQGLIVRLGASKSDQTGAIGRECGIFPGENRSTDPVGLLGDWLQLRGAEPGPLWQLPLGVGGWQNRNEGFIRRAMKEAMAALGIDPREYSTHSLRSGMVTAAVESGAPEIAIMQRTGHRDYKTLLKYAKKGKVFRFDPLKGAL